MIPDQIEREILIAAPVDRVWAVVTQAEHLGTWFGDAGAEVDLRPGGALTMRWKEHGTYLCRVEAVDPPRRFSWRGAYAPDTEPAPGNSTLVEFTLTPEGDGTRLRVVESGFAGTDQTDEEKLRQVQGNIEGWTIELEELRVYVEKMPA